MKSCKVGLVSIGKTGFDLDYAQKIFMQSVDLVKNLGNEVINPSKIVTTEAELSRIMEEFYGQRVDVVIIQMGTFSSGQAVAEFALKFPCPLILWALKEPPLRQEEAKLRLNSLCGANMNASILNKLYKHFKFFYANPEEENFQKNLKDFLKVVEAKNRLEESKIGLLGYRAQGFYDIAFNELALRRIIGPRIYYLDTSEVFARASQISEEDNSVIETMKGLKNLNVSKDEATKSIKAYIAIKKFVSENNLNALAIRCWPEFFTVYGSAACFSLSKLTDEGIPASCEADVEGATTMLLVYYLTDRPPFLGDLISLDEKRNLGTFWHCGSAPVSLAKDKTEIKWDRHYVRNRGITVEFPLKPGDITITRLTYKEDSYRMLITKAEAEDTKMTLKGNTLLVKFHKDGRAVLNTIINEGFEHHFCINYGNITDKLIELCNLLDIEPVLV